jgi:hypothetical protein
MRQIIAIVAIAAAATLAFAARPRYGSAADLRGAKTFYVDTGDDLKTHDDLVTRITSKLPLKLAEDPDHADLIVNWQWTARNCATASVTRIREDKDYLAFTWQDCAGRFPSPPYLFVLHFSRAFESNNS